ncbi:DUF4402 domain-containing protein [Sphingomonas astaxanthinifaciens]|uniref:DUF4402 domain-containing protein n=1 Tax=Sphingomonas astaxanthinifaciens DSM 22298 TaxID=1123267 RepID=A0ABQ5Z5E3_9SPHN|nr:DUF4402 domain-containing protein [Sphingomonas astaxanthinifaciens]GLR46736.1 hypothetical protein GCM10007925_04470 [Sphingomonas astaxanthinifaciens DSM 22298]
MAMRRALCLFLSGLLAAGTAEAQTRFSAIPRAKAGGAFIYPLTVVTKNNLDFGYIAVNGAGTVVVNPNTSVRSVTGGVLALGGRPQPATFLGAARSASVVIIRVPKSPITIRRVGGTETMTVQNFTLQGQDKRTLARMEAFEFNVGATLVVNANQAEGVYTGEFDVTVQYP